MVAPRRRCPPLTLGLHGPMAMPDARWVTDAWDDANPDLDPVEARAAVEWTNARLWAALVREHGVIEGSTVRADVAWKCRDERAALAFAASLRPVADRVGIQPAGERRAEAAHLGIGVHASVSTRASLADLNALTVRMTALGTAHGARFNGLGFHFPG